MELQVSTPCDESVCFQAHESLVHRADDDRLNIDSHVWVDSTFRWFTKIVMVRGRYTQLLRFAVTIAQVRFVGKRLRVAYTVLATISNRRW